MVWARSSPHLFIYPTIRDQTCNQFYHGRLLSMRKVQVPSSNSPQPPSQGRIFWTKEVAEELQCLSTSHSSKVFLDMGCVNTADEPLPVPPFVSNHCLLLSHAISAKALKTFIWSPGSSCNEAILAPQMSKLPILSSCHLFSHLFWTSSVWFSFSKILEVVFYCNGFYYDDVQHS